MIKKETIALGMAGSMLVALYAGISATGDNVAEATTANPTEAATAAKETAEKEAVEKEAVVKETAKTVATEEKPAVVAVEKVAAKTEKVAVAETAPAAKETAEKATVEKEAAVKETAKTVAVEVEPETEEVAATTTAAVEKAVADDDAITTEESGKADKAIAKKDGVDNSVIEAQRTALAANTQGKGYGPQAPRDIDSITGTNSHEFAPAPDYTRMNLCNIHFHEGAEHKGGQFTKYAGNGDGKGHGSGYLFSGELSQADATPLKEEVCKGKYSGLQSGDTIEVHYVHSMAPVKPGSGLGSCLSDSMMNPQLRVETQVYVLTNNAEALDFNKLTHFEEVNGLYQATNIPNNTGEPVVYAGSTTGPGYNEKASPLLVTWSVRPDVAFVNIESVGEWCNSDNAFKEDHAHGVRNLVINPDLLSPIK